MSLTVTWHFLPSAYAVIHISVHKREKIAKVMFKILGTIFSCPSSLSLLHTHTKSCRDHAHCSEKLDASVKSVAEQPGFLYKSLDIIIPHEHFVIFNLI